MQNNEKIFTKQEICDGVTKLVRDGLFLLWLITGASIFFAFWDIGATPFVLTLSGVLTISCIISMAIKKYRNLHVGIQGIYWGLLGLFTAYKFIDVRFSISIWYFVIVVVIYAISCAFVLKKFLNDNKRVKKIETIKTSGVGLAGGLIAIILRRFDIPEFLAVSIIALCFVVFAFVSIFNIRYIVLPDDRILWLKGADKKLHCVDSEDDER